MEAAITRTGLEDGSIKIADAPGLEATPLGCSSYELSCQEAGCFSSGSSKASNVTGLRMPATPAVFNVKHSTLAARVDQELDAHMFSMQEGQPGRSAYLATTQANSGICPEQRAAAIDTMISAASELGLHSEALFTAVSCLDAYLAAQPTHAVLLQPLGMACLWLAAKYEQFCVPSVRCFAQFVRMPPGAPAELQGSTAAPQQLLVLLEVRVLRALDYNLARIVPAKAFVHRTMQLLAAAMQEDIAAPQAASSVAAGAATSAAASAAAYTQQLRRQQQYSVLYWLTSYLAEATLLEYNLLSCKPSEIAAAAFAVAQLLLGLKINEATLECITGHSLASLKAPMQWLVALHAALAAARAAGRPYSVSKIYSSPAALCVANVAPLVSRDDPRLLA